MSILNRLKKSELLNINLLQAKQVVGIEVLMGTAGLEFNLVILKKNKSTLTLVSTHERISHIAELKTMIQKDIPVCIVINGKGLIHKKILVNRGDDDQSLLNKILPNAEIEEFYLQKHIGQTSEDSSAYISVVRRNLIDAILKEFQDHQLEIIQCELGPFCFSLVLPLIDEDSSIYDITCSIYKISVGDGEIKTFITNDDSREEQALKIGDYEIKQNLVLAFSVAFSYFIDALKPPSFAPIVQESFIENRQKSLFKILQWSLLFLFLIALTGNYFTFDHFWKKKNTLLAKVQINQSELERKEKLFMEYEDKISFLENSGYVDSPSSSFYSDQIALDLPGTIKLTRMDIFPLQKEQGSEKSISFEKKKIKLEGLCQRSIELNEWIRILKKKNWVKEVTLINYEQDKSKLSAEFSIEVHIV